MLRGNQFSRVVGGTRVMERDRSFSADARCITEAHIDGYAMDPCREFALEPKRSEAAKHTNHDLLVNILRILGVLHVSRSQRKDISIVPMHKLRKGSHVSLLSPKNEVRILNHSRLV